MIDPGTASHQANALGARIIELSLKPSGDAMDSADFEQLKAIMDASLGEPELARHVLNAPPVLARLPEIRAAIQTYEARYEKEMVALARPTELLDRYLYSEEAAEAVQLEGERMGLTPDSHVLVLGSGAYPVTALLYQRCFSAKCTCVDIDEEAVASSRAFIDAIGLTEQISIHYGDACSFPAEGYSHVFVTLCCQPKRAVFESLARSTASPIAFRRPNALYELWYADVTEVDLAVFARVDDPDRHDEFPLRLAVGFGE